MQVLDQKQSVLVLPNIHINAKNWSKIAIFQVDFKTKQSNFLPQFFLFMQLELLES